MKKSGALLTRLALENIGVTHTFGIPGVHNTEIYDELNKSEQITPVLVTHEGSGAFMADAVSRTSNSIGCCVIVPAAGTTHAMSGIGEAYLDGIPMLIITGGVRTDSGRSYQLHQLDQIKLVDEITKAAFLVKSHEDIMPTIYEAYQIAVSGEPGPVFVEIPVNLQLFKGPVSHLPEFNLKPEKPQLNLNQIKEAASLLAQAKNPGIYVGWGALNANEDLQKLAEMLVAPVATTLQGKSAFPNQHPLSTGVAFGPTGKPASQNAFNQCDALLAIGVRFSEIGTGSYGIKDPKNLIHIDINKEVFDKNYQTTIAIHADAQEAVKALREELEQSNFNSSVNYNDLINQIKKDESDYINTWLKKHNTEKVSPGHFFKILKQKLNLDAKMVVDDGKHTFLAAELFPVDHPNHFISPTDFNCMGYCVPATIATKLVNPQNQVIGIVGDGAFMMTCMELVTASSLGLAPILFVFHDGELGQISQLQAIPLKHKTCSIIGKLDVSGVAKAVGANFVAINNDDEILNGIEQAIDFQKEQRPIIVDVNIDYSMKTRLTKGVVATNLARFSLSEKVRFISRAVVRHTVG